MLAILAAVALSAADEKGVRLVRDDAKQRVDVFVDGQPFTSYIYPSTLQKPVLYPIRSAGGTFVTRGFPLDPRPNEPVDHPHHVGLWFNYGDVNGFDFWNNSDAIKPEERAKMGTVIHKRIASVSGGAHAGELNTDMDWVGGDGKVVLREHTTFFFRGGPGWRSIDRITALQALDARVALTDNKEGVLGLRVARFLEMPSKTPQVYTDAAGRATTVKAVDNTGVTGMYLTSEGKTGDAVWGTRGRWCVLTGKAEKEEVSIAILDHPRNPGFPTYWHARGYGLFAANPLGQKALSNGQETLNFAIPPHDIVSFRYRILILSKTATAEDVEKAYQEFAATPSSNSK